jgi:hypothetical protein
MATFTLDIPELAGVEARWATLPARAKAAIQATLAKSAILTQGIMREEAPSRNGMLRNSISFSVAPGVAIIGTKILYGEAVDLGSGTFGKRNSPITVKTKKVMATRINPGWGIKNAKGYYIIGTHQKGQKANPFVGRTYRRANPLVKAQFLLMIKTLMAE